MMPDDNDNRLPDSPPQQDPTDEDRDEPAQVPGSDAPPAFGTAPGYRSGFVAVLGLPNVGKSTLVNCFFDNDPCIVSYKPQTTRFHIRCISTDERRQIVFVDTPGWHARGRGLGAFMRREITHSLSGADLLLFLVDAVHPDLERNRYAHAVLMQGVNTPRVLAVNKIDRIGSSRVAALLDQFYKVFEPKEIVPISASEETNIDELDRVMTALLPEGPPLYPPETVVDKPQEFLITEFIREQLYAVTREEIPFSCAVELVSVDRNLDPIHVEANILVEKQSQKGILIGAGGSMIARIRRLSGVRIKRFFGRPVDLSLWVKVHPKWAADELLLSRMGEGV
ncbi:MAG: GTPase Era [Candidatus Riflebacteria bacterium]|nr:GTPase Era [Candidatus Riflebacteria bacterium]